MNLFRYIGYLIGVPSRPELVDLVPAPSLLNPRKLRAELRGKTVILWSCDRVTGLEVPVEMDAAEAATRGHELLALAELAGREEHRLKWTA